MKFYKLLAKGICVVAGALAGFIIAGFGGLVIGALAGLLFGILLEKGIQNQPVN